MENQHHECTLHEVRKNVNLMEITLTLGIKSKTYVIVLFVDFLVFAEFNAKVSFVDFLVFAKFDVRRKRQ